MLLFSTGEGGLSAAVRDLLNAGTGAAKDSLLQEAQALGQAVLPLDQLAPTHSSSQAVRSQYLSPVKVSLFRQAVTAEHSCPGSALQLVRQTVRIGVVGRVHLHLAPKLTHTQRRVLLMAKM